METGFYDRKEELGTLRDTYAHLLRGEMLVYYGRRRVGKTELMDQFIREIPQERRLYAYIDPQGAENVLLMLSKAVREQLKEEVKFEDFSAFLRYIGQKSELEKFVLVLDEFQRFLFISPSFIASLQHEWDSLLRHKKLLLILLGSSIGMIQKIMDSKAGALYGRATKIKISPFRYGDFRLMFDGMAEEEKISRYAVFGGTPYYAERARDFEGTLQAIDTLLLKKDGRLREEPKNLLEYENLEVHARYNSILQALSEGKEVMQEIQDFTHLTAADMTAYLKKLDTLLDLIERNDPLLGKGRLGRYRIKDNFFRFWYRFIFPNQTALSLGNTQLVSDSIKKDLNSYIGRIFEEVVMDLLIRYQNKSINGAHISFENIGKWWNRQGEEIDVVAYNKSSRWILLCEVKWSSNPVGIDILKNLERKSRLMDFKGTYQFLLVSKSGFTEECIREMEKSKILSLDLSEMEMLFDEAQKF